MSSFDQAGFDVRFEWGARGAEEVGRGARAIIVVDILRFTTTVDAAVNRGAIIYPYRWRDDSALAFAQSVGAVLAGQREDASAERPFSLSPLSMEAAIAGSKIVLPSPNGAEVSIAAAKCGADVFAGCIRNATAVAAAVLASGPPIAVIAAGERWKLTGAMRPSLEDMLGAGAIVHALDSLKMSPEAAGARAVFTDSRSDLGRLLLTCSSGRELAQIGFSDDVVWASKLNVSNAVPRLCDGAFVAR
jgi:2-phosphosulfolactate phosphatase